MTRLNDPKFKGFNIKVEEWSARPPDGYFHPSTMATWSARQMGLYLIAPEMFPVERMPLTGTLAITQGHFWHMFLQHVLGEDGVMIGDELGFVDDVHMRRGHMDGLLEINGRQSGLEIKTMNSRTITKIKDEAALKEFKYGYWCQAQEYLDVFSLPEMRFLIICPDYPFTMKEFVVKADEYHQKMRRRAYLQAREIAGMSLPLPMDVGPSCCGKPDSCPAQYACQLGRNNG